MNNEPVDQVRLLAADVEPTSELERARQRRKLTEAIAAEVALSPANEAPSGRRRLAFPSAVTSLRTGLSSRRRRYLAGAAAMVVAAAGTAIPLALGGGGAAAAVLTSSRYSLRLPSQYHLTSATTSECHAFLEWAPPPTDTDGNDASTPSYAADDAAAATASGGCVSMVLAPPYTPTATNPDPESPIREETATQHVQVGPYNALIWTGSMYYSAKTGYGPVGTLLYVQFPLAGGQMQDLVVGAEGLSQSQLLALVANGLSVPLGTTSPTAGSSGSTGAAGAPLGNSGANVG